MKRISQVGVFSYCQNAMFYMDLAISPKINKSKIVGLQTDAQHLMKILQLKCPDLSMRKVRDLSGYFCWVYFVSFLDCLK